jgi:hypothetical protein
MQVADWLESILIPQADSSTDLIDLLGESIERTVHDSQEARRNRWIEFQDIGQVAHLRFGIVDDVAYAQVDFWERKKI